MLNAEIIAVIEELATRSLQESWDNTGWQVGNPLAECTGALLCLDVTPEVVLEARDCGCNLVISHHPLIFKGLKQITGATLQQQAILHAISEGISIYSSHTAVDNARGGVSYAMAAKLGVRVLGTLAPRMPATWQQLNVIVPRDKASDLREALIDVGAGATADPRYDSCTFTIGGRGSFRALDGASPAVGDIEALEDDTDEVLLQMPVPVRLISKVCSTIAQVHPYESPAYHFVAPADADHDAGCGVYGTIETRLEAEDLAALAKSAFACERVKVSHYGFGDSKIRISRVALCGGSGGEFIPAAIAAGAQAYVTADIRYHDFVDYGDKILLIDAGHHETELCTKDIFYNAISQKFPTFALFKSSVEKNPVKYI